MKILVTGSTGFLGRVLVRYLLPCKNYKLVLATRVGAKAVPSEVIHHVVRDISQATCWNNALNGVDVIIHCAARAHVMVEEVADPLEEYRKVNVYGTLKLARQAAGAGVKRFIFISSIKVNGETTTGLMPYLPEDKINPQDAYAISKAEAEDGLLKIAQETGMEIVIIRPPLVYGPGVKANFLNLVNLAKTVLPLPFGTVHNRRSLVYIDNLVDFIVKSIDHPAAENQIFLVSDGRDLTLRELVTLLRSAMGKSANLIPVPVFLFKLAGYVFRKQTLVDRLVGSLQVDSSKAKELLNWEPPFTVEQGIQSTVDDFMKGYK